MLTFSSRPPTSCADTGTQCYIEEDLSLEEREERERFLEEKIDNPLSDSSTWNTELPNIGNTRREQDQNNKDISADVQLCSSPELLFEYENTKSSNPLHLSEGKRKIPNL